MQSKPRRVSGTPVYRRADTEGDRMDADGACVPLCVVGPDLTRATWGLTSLATLESLGAGKPHSKELPISHKQAGGEGGGFLSSHSYCYLGQRADRGGPKAKQTQ